MTVDEHGIAIIAHPAMKAEIANSLADQAIKFAPSDIETVLSNMS
ncbi:MAG: hypothetical protein U0M51_01775 [Eggerthellaceae bacterium]